MSEHPRGLFPVLPPRIRPVPTRLVVHAAFMMTLLFFGALGAAEWRTKQIWENDRFAEIALRTLTSAEADFRANDRDENGVNDFWTADLAELYYMKRRGSALKLISKEVADADASPIRPTDFDPIPYHGYYFAALLTDDSTAPRSHYRQETDGRNGKLRHLSKFGFCAFPAKPGVSGHYVIIVNENNSLFWYHDWEGPPPTAWPTDDEIKRRLWRHCGDRRTIRDRAEALASARTK